MPGPIKRYLIRNNRGKVVLAGTRVGDAFVKKVRASQHLFRSGSAWGIDKQVFNEAVADGCKYIIIKDEENKLTYKTTVETFKASSWEGEFGSFNPQLFLKLAYFEVNDPNQEEFTWKAK
ncbi:MAG: hypothetical protein PHY56_00940 [Candidatus Omnitrophica bacterium]|jgi:hypothetical protein|nr:hypothetical protein [Candidatus Omnitrophota bacterium]